jgi:DNA segregation ATPase FtsK/SpoIIIE, S-DNA-T family
VPANHESGSFAYGTINLLGTKVMQYLTDPIAISAQIANLATHKILWLDTEVADWQTSSPRLSLIQVLTQSDDRVGESAWILDVLDRPQLIQEFVQTIMISPRIEKVFHNASYDLRYLGTTTAQNITCTLKLARKISQQRLGTSDLKLKTLAFELANFGDTDIEPQSSDWGVRSLSATQVHYAGMDVVYLAAVHAKLLAFLPQQPTLPLPLETMNTMDSASLTPTKVRIACECPRLFYLSHHFGAKSLFIPPNAVLGVGQRFHALADDFIGLVKREPEFQQWLQPEQPKVEIVSQQMQESFYKSHFFPYLQIQSQQDQTLATSLMQVWQGLRGLIHQFAVLLVTNRQFCSAANVIQQTFIDLPRRVSYEFRLPDQAIQKVAGEIDCAIFDLSRQRLCVVEFKTYAPVDPTAQLAQTALYSYLLSQTRQEPVDAAVYCVLPEFQEFHYPWEELEASIHQVIPYKLKQMQQWLAWQPPQADPPPPTLQQEYLCPMCPEQSRCQTYFQPEPNPEGVAPTAKISSSTPAQPIVVQAPVVRPPTVEPTQPIETIAPKALEQMGQDLVETIRSFRLDTTYQGAIQGPSFIRIKIKPDPGVKVASLLKLREDLQVQLGLDYPPLIAPQAGFVSVDLPRPDRQTAHFENYIQGGYQPNTAPVKIAIGINIDGQLVEADLSDPNTCHFLVGGTTGSGKSEFLRSLLLSLLVRHSPETLKIALVDPKRVTFPEFEGVPWLLTPVVKQTETAIELMDQLVAEMDNRYQRFEQSACSDLKTYNQNVSPNRALPRIVCIFDEYADFMAEKPTANLLELSIKRLGAMARAAGIHLIIATQRPEAKVVTPLIRSNLPGRIALRTASEADSAIVLGGDDTKAADLLGKGDLLYKAGAVNLRLQSLFAKEIRL